MDDFQPLDSAPRVIKTEKFYDESVPFLMLFKHLEAYEIRKARHVAVIQSRKTGKKIKHELPDGRVWEYDETEPYTHFRYALEGVGSFDETNPNIIGWMPIPQWLENKTMVVRP